MLASSEILSSDEAVTSEDEDANGEDLFEMGKNMENLLSNKKTSSQLQREREEVERRKLKKMMMEIDGVDPTKKGGKKDDDENTNQAASPGPPKYLRITRTFKNAAGKEYSRTEIVRKSLVVETYVKIRETKVRKCAKKTFPTPIFTLVITLRTRNSSENSVLLTIL